MGNGMTRRSKRLNLEDAPPRGKVNYEILDRTFKGEIELNRSKHWMRAKTYQEARELSPSSRPVV